MTVIPPAATPSVPESAAQGVPSPRKEPVRHWVEQSWLPLVFLLVGLVFVLFREVAAEVASTWNANSAILLLGLAFSGLLTPHKGALCTEHFFGEIGIAFIVAGLLGVFVEIIFRRREERQHERYRVDDEKRHQTHLKELKENVFKHVLGGFAPDWMSEKVVDLYRTKFLRLGLKLTYVFDRPLPEKKQLGGHKLPDPSDLVTVLVKIRYEVKNLADETTESPISHSFEPTVPISREDHCFTQLKVTRPTGSGTGGKGVPQETKIRKGASEPGHSGENDELRWQKGLSDPRVVLDAETGPLEWKRRTISVKSLRMNRQSSMEVNVEYQSIRWKYDHEAWVSWLPADGLKVVVEVKSGVPRLEFSLEELHPTKFIREGLTWELRDRVLPYQGFTLHWFPAEESRSDVDREPSSLAEGSSANESPASS